MTDDRKTRGQLLEDLEASRRRVVEVSRRFERNPANQRAATHRLQQTLGRTQNIPFVYSDYRLPGWDKASESASRLLP